MRPLYQVIDLIAVTTVGPIIVVTAEPAAVRIFTDALKDTTTNIGRHPADFALFNIGQQNPDTGELTNTEKRLVLSGAQWALSNPPTPPSE